MGAVVGAGKRIEFIRGYLTTVFADDLHAKRVDSLANGTLGVMAGASLAVSIIGQALAQARGLLTKHAIKQVDRLLSNQGIVVWDMFSPWAAEVVGRRKAIVVAMDWTDFDADGQTTLALNLVTDHGRAEQARGHGERSSLGWRAEGTPLVWLTVFTDELKDRRNDYEDLCVLDWLRCCRMALRSPSWPTVGLATPSCLLTWANWGSRT